MSTLFTIEKGEQVIYQARKHWIVYVADLVGLVLLTLLPLVAGGVLFAVAGGEVSDKILLLYMFGYAALLLVVWIYMFLLWTDYYLDVWIVTDQKLIDVEQKGIFFREVSTMRLEKIQDVTIEVNGIVATWLQFGDLHVQTAAENATFVMKGIAKPHIMKEKILQAAHSVDDQLLKRIKEL